MVDHSSLIENEREFQHHDMQTFDLKLNKFEYLSLNGVVGRRSGTQLKVGGKLN